MKYSKFLIISFLFLVFSTEIQAYPFDTAVQVYEDAEDTNTNGWSIYDNRPSGATITNIFDDEKQSRVIKFNGEGRSNGYLLGNNSGENVWNNTTEHTIHWNMKFDEKFKIYVLTRTTKGIRYFYYDYKNTSVGLYEDKYIRIGLGKDKMDGTWKNIVRDLDADLKKYESDNRLISINGIRVKGSGLIDDIALIGNPNLSEKFVLGILYDGTDGDNWHRNANWLEGDPCDNQWEGIVCVDGKVTELHLRSNGLKGVIPLEELAYFSTLKVLDLGNNQLTGILPATLSNLEQLTTLNLNNNELSGEIPREFEELIQLQYLDLSNNQLAGTIPKELGNLTNLEELDLSNNQLTGIIPPQLGNLNQVYNLNLAENQLTGFIPTEFGNLFVNVLRVAFLNLSNNQLTGNIPSELGRPNSELWGVDFSNNQLTGNIPVTFAHLKLDGLNLSHNELSGNLPLEITQCSRVNGNIDLKYNHLSNEGSNKEEIDIYLEAHHKDGKAGFYDTQTAVTIYEDAEDGNTNGWSVYDNRPSGAMITNVFDNDKQSRVIKFEGDGRNNGYLLGDSRGDNTWNNTTANVIHWNMKFDEKFKIYLLTQTKKGIRYFYYDYKDKSKGLYSNKYIRIGLGKDKMDGTWKNITRDLNADLKKYESDNELIAVNGIRVKGSGFLDDIEMYVNDSSNQTEILKTLYASTNGDTWRDKDNWLEGDPCDNHWYGVTCEDGKVIELDLVGNNIGGTVPPELGSLYHLKKLNLFANSLTGTIPSELGNLSELIFLSLADNKLTGNIPSEFGNLSQLVTLDLLANDLTGEIPIELGNLMNLRFLYLGGNEFIGTIPDELLNRLEEFDQMVKYKSFDKDIYFLNPYNGAYISLLVDNEGDYDSQIIQEMVATLDNVYDEYQNATGRTPELLYHRDGLLSIAVVDATCGAGCGYLGFTGIEILNPYFQSLYNTLQTYNQYEPILFYELGRNFWFYGNKIDRSIDFPQSRGAMTTGYAVFMKSWIMEKLEIDGRFRDEDNILFDEKIKNLLNSYLSDLSYNFANTIAIDKAPINEDSLGGADMFASFLFALQDKYGNVFTEQLWKEVGNRPDATNMVPSTDNFIIAASITANEDLRTLFQTWKWPAPSVETNKILDDLY